MSLMCLFPWLDYGIDIVDFENFDFLVGQPIFTFVGSGLTGQNGVSWLLRTLANEIEILLKSDQAYASRKIIKMQKRDLPFLRIIQIMYNILGREIRRIQQFRKYDRLWDRLFYEASLKLNHDGIWNSAGKSRFCPLTLFCFTTRSKNSLSVISLLCVTKNVCRSSPRSEGTVNPRVLWTSFPNS